MIITRTVLLASCAFIACGGAARAMSPETSSSTHSPMTQAHGDASGRMASVSHEMMRPEGTPINEPSHGQSVEEPKPMLTPDTSETQTTEMTHGTEKH